MAFDIYGERLEKGFCEVHPWVKEYYPCSLCMAEEDGRKVKKQLQQSLQSMKPEPHKAYLLCVHASTNTTRHWVVFASTPSEAINKLNYQIRRYMRERSQTYPNDKYVHLEYMKDWLNALRRYKRRYSRKFGSCNHQALNIYELLPDHVYSVAYFEIIEGQIPWYGNILPEVAIPGTKTRK